MRELLFIHSVSKLRTSFHHSWFRIDLQARQNILLGQWVSGPADSECQSVSPVRSDRPRVAADLTLPHSTRCRSACSLVRTLCQYWIFYGNRNLCFTPTLSGRYLDFWAFVTLRWSLTLVMTCIWDADCITCQDVHSTLPVIRRQREDSLLNSEHHDIASPVRDRDTTWYSSEN